MQQPHPLTICSPFGVTFSTYLRSLLFNAHSIPVNNKLSELHHLLYNVGYDFLLITETWLRNDILTNLTYHTYSN